MAISFTMGQEPQAGWKKARLAGAAALAAVAATLLMLGIIRHGKRKKRQENAMLDPLTGLGNAQCYEVRFRDVTADRVRDLYYVGYLAWEDAKAKELLSPKEQEEVQQIAAHQLASHISGTEFLCRIAEGVFAVVYHCSNREEAADRMGEMILSLKKYLAEFRQEYTGLFRAGICPLEENPDCDARGACTMPGRAGSTPTRKMNCLPLAHGNCRSKIAATNSCGRILTGHWRMERSRLICNL